MHVLLHIRLTLHLRQKPLDFWLAHLVVNVVFQTLVLNLVLKLPLSLPLPKQVLGHMRLV